VMVMVMVRVRVVDVIAIIATITIITNTSSIFVHRTTSLAAQAIQRQSSLPPRSA
jgi:hypothetical protein